MAKPYILIAEDDPSLQTVIAETFRIAGYQVDATGDGDEVLPLFEGRRPDAVVLDVSMPGKNGFEVCRELRARPDGRTLPIVVLTARTADADRHWGIDAGADEYLTKPFDPGSLTAAVAGLIESRLRGEDRNPISKLPDFGSLARRIAELERSGQPLTAVAVEFEPESAAVYRQKYGDLRFADAIRAAAGCLRQALAAVVVDTPGLAAPAPLPRSTGSEATSRCGSRTAAPCRCHCSHSVRRGSRSARLPTAIWRRKRSGKSPSSSPRGRRHRPGDPGDP
jgi:DNA-binding response OmpR family regulator